jgi:hypothetical protein
MKMAVFRAVVPYIPVEFYQRFGSASCLHYQGDRSDDGDSKDVDKLPLHGAKTQKTAIFILTAVRISNLIYQLQTFLQKNLSPPFTCYFCQKIPRRVIP